MRIVRLLDDVGDRQLELVGVKAARLVVGHETVTRPEVEKNVRGLRDDERSRSEERRCERAEPRRMQELHHRLHPAPFGLGAARDVDVGGVCLFEREANELSPPLNRRPIKELVGIGHG